MLVEHDQTCLLVDCGFSLRKTEQRLAQLGRCGADLNGILVTHEHTDHGRGVKALSDKYQLPVFLTAGSARHASLAQLGYGQIIRGQRGFSVGDIAVRAVTVPHDAREPCQYVFDAAGQRLGLLTDLGHVTPAVTQAYRGCDILFLESNHDEQMLAEGRYPPSLKRRVAGQWGHLSNRQCRQFLQDLNLARLQQLVLGHISEQNNTRERVAAALPAAELEHCEISCAQQDQILDWIDVR